MLESKKVFWVALLVMIMTSAGFSSVTFAGEATKPLIIDVRTEREWNSGHIEGAILIPFDELGKRIGAVTKDKAQKIYVYCRTGRRTAIAKKTLVNMGYQDIVDLGSLADAARFLKLKIVK